jgi:hypothetical protein
MLKRPIVLYIMTLKALYPFTGSMMLIGTAVMLYGLQDLSPVLFFEGAFLAWLGFSITVNVWEANRLDM